MLFELSSFISLFKYISIRAFGAVTCSFILGMIFAPTIIALLKKHQKQGQPIRADGPDGHMMKKGTPTMGGLLILLSSILNILLWCDLHNPFVWIMVFILVSYGLIGAIDDYLKILKKNSNGLSAKSKFFLQCLFAFIGSTLSIHYTGMENATILNFPFIKTWMINIEILYIPFSMFVIVGSSNAVNLTDGLDGLAIVPSMIAIACLGLIAYLTGHIAFSKYLYIPSICGTGELTIVCASLIGAGLSFLWHNTPPAQVFMGDVGSLSLGGALGILSVLVKHEIVFAIIGGVFVIETLSVMIQVAYFRATKGKRIFLMTPIHHHFEKKGWSESTIVIRFWIASVMFAILGLATLKFR